MIKTDIQRLKINPATLPFSLKATVLLRISNTYDTKLSNLMAMKNVNELVKKNLRMLVEKSGKSIDRIGLESNTHKSTISRILSGKLNPSVKVLGDLAEYFEVDVREFFKP